jgi:hypothetical protein
MAATQIKSMNSAHDQILDLVLASPCMTLRELSAATGYTPCWLSQVIRSDIFQAEYSRRREGVEVAIFQPINEKLQAIAHLAIDRMEGLLQRAEDPDTVIDAFDKVMHRTGYAPNSNKSPAGMNIQQNNFFATKEDLERIRTKMLSDASNVIPFQPVTLLESNASEG